MGEAVDTANSTCDAKVAAVGKDIADVKNQISFVKGVAYALAAAGLGLAGWLTYATNAMSDLRGDLDSIVEDIASLNSTVGALATSIASLGDRVVTLKEEVDRINPADLAKQVVDEANRQIASSIDDKLAASHVDYSVLAQVQAQAACVALAGTSDNGVIRSGLVAAARRPVVDAAGQLVPPGSGKDLITCQQICGAVPSANIHGAKGSCFNSLHVYPGDQPKFVKGSNDIAATYWGLRTHVYNGACDVTFVGPNYCCCTVQN